MLPDCIKNKQLNKTTGTTSLLHTFRFFLSFLFLCRFDQLESGTYPSFKTVGLFLANGIDIETLLDMDEAEASDSVDVYNQFHATNPFRELLIPH